MVDPSTVPLSGRSLTFPDGMFHGTVDRAHAAMCERCAQVARAAVATSDNPLLCLARAAWWAAVAARADAGTL